MRPNAHRMPQPIPSEVSLNVVKVLSLAPTPLSAAAIAKALPFGGRPTPRALQSLLAELVETGKAYRHPTRTKAGKPVYALHPADPAEFLANDLDKLIAAVAAKGFAANDVRRAAVRLLTAESSPIGPDSASKGDTRP